MREKNHLPRIDHIWIAVSVDEDGTEGVCAFYSPNAGGWMPMFTASEKALEGIIGMAEAISRERQQVIKIIKLSTREEILKIDRRQ
jgi:hypothetical protein